VATHIASQIVLILTAAILFYAALTDLKHYKIGNELVFVLTGLFFLHAILSGRWIYLHWNIGFAAALFVLMLYFYSMKLMGGGDIKLLTVAFLWVAPSCALPFALFLVFFIGIHLLGIKLKLVEARMISGRVWVAFAPSIAAALISVFMVGCLQPI
jgi:prepilin peptidase CpaA